MQTSFKSKNGKPSMTAEQYVDQWAERVVELFIQEIYQGRRAPKAPDITTRHGILTFRATLSGSNNILNRARPVEFILAGPQEVMLVVIDKLIDRQEDLEGAIVKGQEIYRRDRGLEPLGLAG